MSEPNNNVESILTAILKNDSKYVVTPQSRVEELLLAIYENGGGGGGGSDITRYEVEQMLLGKVDVKKNYSLVSDSEIERLAGVDNYDDRSIRDELGKKVQKENGYSLIKNEDYDNFKKLENYDDSELRNLINSISDSLNSLVPNDRTIAGKKLDKNISVNDLLTALSLDKVNNTSDADKPISNATQAALDTKSNKTFIESADNETSIVTVPGGTSFAAVGKICGKTVKDGEVLKSAPVKSVVSLGKNLWDEKWEVGDILYDSGSDLASTTRIRTKGYTQVIGGMDLYISAPNPINLFIYDSNKNYLGKTTGGLVQSINNTYITLPSNARYIRAEFTNTYGTSYKNNIAFVSGTFGTYTPYNKTTVSIPQEILDLPDYGCSAGDVYNWVDFENMVYHHNVGKFDLGTPTYGYLSTYNAVITTDTSLSQLPAFSGMGSQNVICHKYDTSRAPHTSVSSLNNIITVSSNNWSPSRKTILIKDDTITEASLVNGKIPALNGVMMYHELATPEVIDISSILYPFPVESGGTITFENEHNLDINNKVIYQKGMV